jgi:hypothetical protein
VLQLSGSGSCQPVFNKFQLAGNSSRLAARYTRHNNQPSAIYNKQEQSHAANPNQSVAMAGPTGVLAGD